MVGTTCENKGGSIKVTCGPGYFEKDGSTTCTTCANDGTECCTRMLCIYFSYLLNLPRIPTARMSVCLSYLVFVFGARVWVRAHIYAIQMHNKYSHINAWQGRHAETETDPQKSRVGPTILQKMVPRLARLAPMMGLNVALVRSLFAAVVVFLILFTFCFCRCVVLISAITTHTPNTHI